MTILANGTPGDSADSIYQNIRLYIEGVEVLFNSITINQGYGVMPSASISIPPSAGLMDIARFYSPKVHIYFTERGSGIREGKSQDVDKVLFTGIIAGAQYSKSRDGNGSMSIVFNCVHRYHLITEMILDYCGFTRGGDLGGPPTGYSTNMSSTSAIIQSLSGISQTSTGTIDDYPALAQPTNSNSGRTDILPSFLADYADRLVGMPSVVVNFWNQANQASYAIKTDTTAPGGTPFNSSFINIYKPLIEEGLKFFQRLAGHYPLEYQINRNKQQACDSKSKILIPPCKSIFLKSAIQANLTVTHMSTFLQASGEVTNLYQVFQTYFNSIDYDMLTLASPAEVPINSTTGVRIDNPVTYAVDTLVKPGMPFYFSPRCNVIYPSMYTSISVTYDELDMPTRLNVTNNATAVGSVPDRHFRSPASIRDAIAFKKAPDGSGTLSTTADTSYGAVGLYEMGRGIKFEYTAMPDWLGSLIQSFSSSSNTAGNSQTDNTAFSLDALEALRRGWAVRYPNSPKMNPFDPASGIQPYETILYATADYYYTKKYASTKSGSVSGVFNPYVIPGYPMDILEANPNLPSFHAMCTTVTHNITSSSISTHIDFVAAMTYSELANYYIPFVNPYLQVALGLAANPTLVNNTPDSTPLPSNATLPDPYKVACQFYQSVLGVDAVTPEMLFGFNTSNAAQSVKIENSGTFVADNRKWSDHSTEEDILTLCIRPIENKDDFASRSDIIYIDLTKQNYAPPMQKYADPNII